MSDGRNRWTPIDGLIIIKTVFKKYKNASYKIQHNKKVWNVTEFSKALNAPMGLQGRNILLFVHNCASQ